MEVRGRARTHNGSERNRTKGIAEREGGKHQEQGGGTRLIETWTKNWCGEEWGVQRDAEDGQDGYRSKLSGRKNWKF